MTKKFLKESCRVTALTLSFALLISVFSPVLAQENLGKPAKNNFAPHVPGEIIIKFKDSQKPDNIFLAKHNLKSTDKILKQEKFGADRIYLAKNNDSQNLENTIDALRQDLRVEYAEPNYLITADAIPNDPSFSKLWGLSNVGQTGGTTDADIDALEAWDIQTGSNNAVIGVIDTGVDYNHPDLAANIWTNPGEIASDGIDNDGNGYADDTHGWNFVNNTGNPFDDHGHGTHVAGTIGAAGNNGIGITGINWSVKIAALKFLDASGSGTTAGAIGAINYANTMGFKITNNSWGGGGYSQALYDAIAAANADGNLFVASAGNSKINTDIRPSYPASYNLPNIISIAATDSKDSLASFSNYGAASVDLGAPGVNIYSTVPSGNCALCDPSGYASYSGTSMASPHVAGVAGLIKAQFPTLDAASIKARILNSANPVASLQGKTLTGGRLNAYDALFTDNIPPSTIINLSVSGASHDSATLSWSAPSDNGSTKKASSYDIRFSTSLISDDSDWANASQALGEPTPKTAGSPESFTITSLISDTAYYFAIRSTDSAGNISALSNITFGRTAIMPATDTITATKATYSKSRKELTVEAISDQSPAAVLTVEGFGIMAYNSSTGKYQYKKRPTTNPGSITITSSLGGAATKTITQIR